MTSKVNYGYFSGVSSGIAGNDEALLAVLEIEKQKLNYAIKFI